jgi:DNA polymerase (family 10)
MEKKEISKVLEEIGKILEIKGENPFKTRAYYNAARTIETLGVDINQLVESGEIANIKGIGKALSEKISLLVKTGTLPYYEDLKASLPDGLLEMLSIPGLGPKKVRAINEKLHISSIGELEYACLENRLRDLEGFGQKSQDKILHSIYLYKKYSERFLYSIAELEAQELLEYLKKQQKVIRLHLAGSLRRRNEIVKDIDIIASCFEKDRKELMQYFIDFPQRESVINQGTTKSTVVLNSGLNCDLRLVNDAEFAYALHHFTGSKEHNTAMRTLAKSMNMKMNEYGLYRMNERIKCKNERDIFNTLSLQYIPPELRENMGEIEAAQKNELPNLYNGDPFYGLFHVHTNYSDGANSISEIVEACKKMGLQYLGICDHSKSAFYANGLDEIRITEQHKEIDLLNSKLIDFRIFKGIEVDILPDGQLDFPDTFLVNFDFVIASVHSSFGLDKNLMTKRIIRAIENPNVTMLGHPTGRLLLGREPYSLDMESVIKSAGKMGKVIEINSSPYRLDLDWRWGKFAKLQGIKTALNPDAHSVDGLLDYKYGIGIARKGWFERHNILNSYTAKEIANYFDKSFHN